ncbi:hypothetical protein HK096_011192, partial [Nowakowskiella sp. JEL0078]
GGELLEFVVLTYRSTTTEIIRELLSILQIDLAKQDEYSIFLIQNGKSIFV